MLSFIIGLYDSLLLYNFRVFESPYDCIHDATYWFYDYFGFNVTYACRGAENVTAKVTSDWQEIVSPFCGDSVPETANSVEDICPTPDPNNPPPEGNSCLSRQHT